MEVTHTHFVHPALARQTPGKQESLGTSPGCSCQVTPPLMGEGRGDNLTGVRGTACSGDWTVHIIHCPHGALSILWPLIYSCASHVMCWAKKNIDCARVFRLLIFMCLWNSEDRLLHYRHNTHLLRLLTCNSHVQLPHGNTITSCYILTPICATAGWPLTSNPPLWSEKQHRHQISHPSCPKRP